MRKLLALSVLFGIAAFAFANGTTEQSSTASSKPKEYTVFLGYPKDDYPKNGTIFGDWLEKKTGVKINWEFIVGDLKQKVGLIAASGDYPDAIDPRNETQILLSANAFIPLNKLVDQYGPNIKSMYGKQINMIKQPDGNLYWFPQVMPYGNEYRNPLPGHGLYIQAAVLKDWNYQIPDNLEDTIAKLIQYAKDHPTINGKPTIAYTGSFWSWENFPVMNAPSIFTGHPNDGSANVDWINGKWVASEFYDSQAAYRVYKLYNRIYQAGLYDTESFVMDHDQYLAKLSGGNILAFYDQDWHFSQVQELLLKQNQDHWYVAIPEALKGYQPTILNPPQPQVSEGIGISVDAKDPVGLMKYFNFLADWTTQKMREWGRPGVDYEVGADGVFSRTQAQIDQWRDGDWRNHTYGADYWSNFLRVDSASLYPDGKNNIDPGYQPSVFQKSLTPQEQTVLDGLHAKTWASIFPPVDLKRSAYFPAWTITLPTGSTEDITNTKILDLRVKYIPLLVMAKDDATYDSVWNQFTAAIDKIPKANRDALTAYYQKEIDKRVNTWGGF